MASNEDATENVSIISSKSRAIALDFKRRQLVFDSFIKLRNLRQYKRARGSVSSTKGSSGTLIYTWGAGFYGQLGRVGRGTDRCSKVAMVVELPVPLVQVSCGGFHTAVLSDNGQVYCWGDGRAGQLGNLDKQHNMQPVPKLVDRLVTAQVNVVMIACGQYHTVALTADEGMYSWGSGKYGQLGHGARFDERYPKRVEIDANVLRSAGSPMAVSAGDRHTCVITKNLKVLSFGGGEHGQLGHGNGDDVMSPKIIESLSSSRCLQTSCGATNTAVVTEPGLVYVWGFGENLHPKDAQHISYEPKQVRFNEKVKQVACGHSHVLLLTVSGDVYCYGSGTEGQIGHGSTSNVRVPRLVLRSKNIYEVCAGRYHSTALSSHGVLYSWGCGESGQLGHNHVENENFPKVVESLLGNVTGQVSCGEHHTASLTSAEYSAVSQDVLYWKALEDEELRLKKLMLRKSPTGLKSREIKQVEMAREKITARHEEKMSQMETEEAASIVKRISTIKKRELITSATTKKLEQEDNADLESSLLQSVPSDRAPRDNASAASPLPKLARKPMKASSSSPSLKGKKIKEKVQQHNVAPESSVERDGNNLFLQRPQQQQQQQLTRKKSARTAAELVPLSHHQPQPQPQPTTVSERKMQKGKSVPNLNQKRQADGNPLVSRIMFFEKASSALRLVKASLEKETPQYMVDNTNIEEIFRNRERLDKIRHEIRRKSAKLQELKSVYKFMKPAPEDIAMAEKREAHIKELNMKLLTLNTRQVEAEENKKNYELNILRMKDERLELSKKIEALRGLLADHERLYQKVSAMSDRVLSEKQSVDSEIRKFKADMEGFRKFFAFQLKSYHQILINKISNSREQERKVREKNNRSEERKRDRVLKMKDECDKIIEEGQRYRQQLQELVQKLEYYEERFHKIKLATGLSDPQDIIDKFYFNEEIDRELKEEIAAHKSVIAKLKTAKTVSLIKLEEQKSKVVDSKWKDVDQLQEKYREVTLRMVRRRGEVEQMNQKLAFVQEGLLSLINAIDSAEGVQDDLGGVSNLTKPGPNDSCLVILAALQHRLGKLTHSLGVFPGDCVSRNSRRSFELRPTRPSPKLEEQETQPLKGATDDDDDDGLATKQATE